MEILTRVHADNLVRFAKNKPKIIAMSADLTNSVELDGFKSAYPERFFSMGIAEQNMLSWAGGMAREGFVPLVHTFGVFIYRRAYDQIAMSVAYPDLPVKMFGFLPGIMTPGGATHQAIEDIALMRALPNMTVLECADATETKSVLDLAYGIPGPVYVRMLRGDIPRLFDETIPMALDTPRLICTGTDLTLFSSGICTEEAMRAVVVLREKGLTITHVHVSTLKPFCSPMIVEYAAQTKFGVITMENHTVIGGLGSAVAERMAEAGIGKKLYRIGLQDTFVHGASKQYLMKEYGLDAFAVVNLVENITGKRFDIKEEQLKKTSVGVTVANMKPEDL